jgi:hypothetical protein
MAGVGKLKYRHSFCVLFLRVRFESAEKSVQSDSISIVFFEGAHGKDDSNCLIRKFFQESNNENRLQDGRKID